MTIALDPVIGSWGSLTLRWYGLIILASIVLGFVVCRREAVRVGLPVAAVDDLLPIVIPAGIVGARLFHALDHWDRFVADPASLLALQEGGLAIYGAVLGGVIATLLYAHARRLDCWRLVDALTPGLLLGQAIGRLACVVNGDAYGRPTTLPWAFTYTNPAALMPVRLLGVPTHPYPVYEMLWDLTLWALLWRLRDRHAIPGSHFLTYAALYAVGRLVLTTFRAEPRVLLGLQEAQVAALAVLAAVSFVVIRRASWPGIAVAAR